MTNHGFVRVAAACPQIIVADCNQNTNEILKMIDEAENKQVATVVFPELCVTAYTCADLFFQRTLIAQVEDSIRKICAHLSQKTIVAIVGIPLIVENRMYNVAAVIAGGTIHGFVPKTYLPNYNEFYEKRWFASATELTATNIHYIGQQVPIGTDLLFETESMHFGIEICEDLWTPIPPSSILALGGAQIVFNLSASDEVVGKHAYRKQLVAQQSARCLSAYVYTTAGCGESSTDLVFSGGSIIAENGSIVAEGERFSLHNRLTVADIDVDRLQCERIKNTSFSLHKLGYTPAFRCVKIKQKANAIDKLTRYISPTPFVPTDDNQLHESCDEIFAIQVAGLSKRLIHTNTKSVVIGVSGGLDSTLALLVVAKAFDRLSIPRSGIYGITMPGFGTTNRTYTNAIGLMKALGVTIKEISIKDAVMQHFSDIEHDINVHDITYENAQARERTQILMDYGNKVNGFVIGTGDMSELALGWCTYNGDHISMYAVNSGVPKTLVRTLVSWVANTYIEGNAKDILHDIVDTPVSPELLPTDADGKTTQLTEDVVGPYILHDFYLYYIIRFGFTPTKIYFLAKHAFENQFSDEEILKWLKTFYRRFFSQQFKRSCMPDGPKVGSINLSPRGDWRMPSDASASIWLHELEKLN